MISSGTASGLAVTVSRVIEIALPDISTQEMLVNKITKEMELVNSSKNLIQVFEARTQAVIAKSFGSQRPDGWLAVWNPPWMSG